MEERLNSTKPLHKLNELESELRYQKAEVQEIINATAVTMSERAAAETRVTQINEELVRLQTQITEREVTMPL